MNCGRRSWIHKPARTDIILEKIYHKIYHTGKRIVYDFQMFSRGVSDYFLNFFDPKIGQYKTKNTDLVQ